MQEQAGVSVMNEQAEVAEYASSLQIATRFGISRATVYRLLNDGKIEAVKVGGATRFIVASVERYYASLPRVGGSVAA